MTTELSAVYTRVYLITDMKNLGWNQGYSLNLVLKSPFGSPSHFENLFKTPFQDLKFI